MIDREKMQILAESKFTVEILNNMLKRRDYRGFFDSEAEAVGYAKKEAGRSRKFATFTVYTGTPKNPGKAVKGHEYKGTK